MKVEKLKYKINKIINQTKLKVAHDKKQVKVNINYHVLNDYEGKISEIQYKETAKKLDAYMDQKIVESRQDGGVRISKLSDGRYAFYQTKTPILRKINEHPEPLISGKGLYLNYDNTSDSKQINVGIDLVKLRKRSSKTEMIHFRVNREMKKKLDDMCAREEIRVSDFLRELLRQTI
ncbi:hypothetical protein ACFSMW_11065 [Virgibacillus halophilus]|uniref:Ribbon-helix-helix protein, copG family n=1 Tax=Tigheibacillus halophilus TaxID=361280 RepID=A0ABU5C6F7_9BACI|nr:hypothetical protein [Virgibacillus halophilus]